MFKEMFTEGYRQNRDEEYKGAADHYSGKTERENQKYQEKLKKSKTLVKFKTSQGTFEMKELNPHNQITTGFLGDELVSLHYWPGFQEIEIMFDDQKRKFTKKDLEAWKKAFNKVTPGRKIED